MSNDVERLELARRVKMAADSYAHDGMHPKYAAHIADELLKSGVTLPTPPRATPLEAAAAALAAFDGIAWDAMMRESREIRRRGASSILAAAVGALSEEDVRAVGRAYAYPDCDDGVVEARGVLLVRLTEGGAT